MPEPTPQEKIQDLIDELTYIIVGWETVQRVSRPLTMWEKERLQTAKEAVTRAETN